MNNLVLENPRLAWWFPLEYYWLGILCRCLKILHRTRMIIICDKQRQTIEFYYFIDVRLIDRFYTTC